MRSPGLPKTFSRSGRETLERIARAGTGDFYRGEPARPMAEDLVRVDSPLTANDLVRHRAQLVDSLQPARRSGTLCNMIPPTQGVVSLLILAPFDVLDVHSVPQGSAGCVHLCVGAARQVFSPVRVRHCAAGLGGDGQPQTRCALFTRAIEHGMGVQAAVSAPRWLLGRTWGKPSESLKRESRFDAAVVSELAARGHDVEIPGAFDETAGHAGMIIRHAGGILEGGADPRSDGGVAAY